MKWLMRIFLVAALGGLGWWTWDHFFVTDERRIQKLIAAMERTVEQGQVLRLEGAIAQDYSDDYGFDKTTLLAAVRSAHQQYSEVLIHITDMKITVAPDRQSAQAIFIVKILARQAGSVADTEIRTERPRLHFRKSDQGWRLVRTETPELNFE
jgi:hypothetical protein